MDKTKQLMNHKRGCCLLAYLYGMENGGDFAICYGALDYLTQRYDLVYAVSRYSEKSPDFHDSAEVIAKRYGDRVVVIPGPYTLDRSSKVTTLHSYFRGALTYVRYSVLPWRTYLLKDCECIYLNGGNLLRCESPSDYIRLKPILYFAKVAKRLHIPYVVLPHSMASLNSIGRKEICTSLDGATVVYLRESLSFKKAQELGCFNARQSIDMAYFIDDERPCDSSLSDNYVCFTFRNLKIGDIGYLEQGKQDAIVRDMTRAIESIAGDGQEIVFVVQTLKDLDFTLAMAEAVSCDVRVIEEHDALRLRGIYRGARCLLGMRLHSLILASSVGTPVVGYFDKSWGLKNPGTLGDICMPFAFVGEAPDLYEMYETSCKSSGAMSALIDSRKAVLYSGEEG